jgi:hypothetical protein
MSTQTSRTTRFAMGLLAQTSVNILPIAVDRPASAGLSGKTRALLFRSPALLSLKAGSTFVSSVTCRVAIGQVCDI